MENEYMSPGRGDVIFSASIWPFDDAERFALCTLFDKVWLPHRRFVKEINAATPGQLLLDKALFFMTDTRADSPSGGGKPSLAWAQLICTLEYFRCLNTIQEMSLDMDDKFDFYLHLLRTDKFAPEYLRPFSWYENKPGYNIKKAMEMGEMWAAVSTCATFEAVNKAYKAGLRTDNYPVAAALETGTNLFSWLMPEVEFSSAADCDELILEVREATRSLREDMMYSLFMVWDALEERLLAKAPVELDAACLRAIKQTLAPYGMNQWKMYPGSVKKWLIPTGRAVRIECRAPREVDGKSLRLAREIGVIRQLLNSPIQFVSKSGKLKRSAPS
ncbi:MAG: hypothetical protein Q7R35_10700 [Elusimicrobiota bacterium]|nr:hypothetical protein [Elusimicrobiota bacterium]